MKKLLLILAMFICSLAYSQYTISGYVQYENGKGEDYYYVGLYDVKGNPVVITKPVGTNGYYEIRAPENLTGDLYLFLGVETYTYQKRKLSFPLTNSWKLNLYLITNEKQPLINNFWFDPDNVFEDKKES